MPSSTSLVTNLPADFNTFGQAVDTSMSELLGGTTGQVLSKTSGTNMDFTWVTPTDQTPLTTKGDLFTFTTVDARLGVGTNGYILSANSSAATGLEWIANDQGDLTAITAGTGISVTSGTGPIPTIAIDTTVTVDKTTAQTLTNKTLTSPALTTPTISTLTTSGDTIYGTGSGAISRLGIGSTGQILTVAGGIPSWATPAASASGLTLITSSTMSAVNTKTIDSCFTTTYDNYLILASFSVSSGANVKLNMRASGSTNTTAVYDFFNERVRYDNTIAIADTGLAQTSWNYMGSIGSAAGYYSTIAFEVFGPKLARNTTVRGQVNDISTSSSVFAQYNSVGNFRDNTQFDGFILAMTGAPTMTGEIRVYGYQNS
jgi:hypothetical protein